MAKISRDQVKFTVIDGARDQSGALKNELGEESWREFREGFQKYLCEYFSSSADCTGKLEKGISPVGRSPKGGKCLKVRWVYPGCGKRGGLRIAVVAFCDERNVVLVEAFRRKDSPTDALLVSKYHPLSYKNSGRQGYFSQVVVPVFNEAR